MPSPIRLVVLISGHGSNLQAILDACGSGELSASVLAVISDRPGVYGLTRARNAGVEAIYFPKRKNEPRHNYDTRLADRVRSLKPDLIVLAGWMRLLTDNFLSSFPDRVINLHPALPGMFPGTHAIERAYEAYRRGEIDHNGIMVHRVPDEGVDNGPVLASETVRIRHDDTLESLKARVHDAEHRTLISVIKILSLASTASPSVSAAHTNKDG